MEFSKISLLRVTVLRAETQAYVTRTVVVLRRCFGYAPSKKRD